MKSQNLSVSKGIQPLLFCFGMFLLAMSFAVVVCFSMFYAFHSMSSNAGVATAGKVHVTEFVKSM